MIVTCDQCGQRARIKAEKLPPQGGKIRCPQCANVIIVKPPGGARTKPGATTAPPKTTESEVVSSSESAVAAPPAKKAEAPPAASAPKQSDAGEGGSDKPSTWKLRVSGLTYSFQTLESLHQWLSGRDSLEGIRVARDTDDWHELGDYPEVVTDALKIRFFPESDVPTTSSVANQPVDPAGSDKDAADPAKAERAARKSTRDMALAARRSRRSTNRKSMVDSAAATNRMQKRPARRGGKGKAKGKASASSGGSRVGLYLGFLMLCLAAAGGLHFAGVIDLGIILPAQAEQEGILEATPEERAALGGGGAATNRASGNDERRDTTAPTAPTPPPVDEMDDEEEARIEAELAAEQLANLEASLTRADELMSERRWAEARAILEPQAKLWPDHLDVNAALLRVYEKLGKREEASEQRELVEQLEAKAETDGGDTE